MNPDFINRLYRSHAECPRCPAPEAIGNFFTDLLGTMFPDFRKEQYTSEEEIRKHMLDLQRQLTDLVDRNREMQDHDPELIAHRFFDGLPEVYDMLLQDAEATYKGDPAARSVREVIRSYPGFFATAAYRLAHLLLTDRVRIIPRILTEYAHSKTGIDIHPGAVIGRHFCIDHGTGVVIGETTHIGEHVKIYQGVTLGALSVRKEDAEKKRHPTIEEHVVIYSGATILGGDTVVGARSIIGGNVWLTESVPADSRIYYRSKIQDGLQTDTQ